MIRQTLLATLTYAGFAALACPASAKPVSYDCQLQRQIFLGGKDRGTDSVSETVAVDLPGKRLTVGRRTGAYVVTKLNEATMTGLPGRDRITFDLANGTLTTFDVSEFGEVVRRNGKCIARKG